VYDPAAQPCNDRLNEHTTQSYASVGKCGRPALLRPSFADDGAALLDLPGVMRIR
jgi:hypothetical protein